MMSIIEVKDLSIGFERPIQEELNFSLNEGEILFVKGRNGAGKSTLIKTLCHKLKALSGEIIWNVNENQVSLLPQSTSHEFPISITLEEIVNVFEPDEKTKSLLPSELYSRKFNNASGGERQKALILTRLKKDTKVLILDEPFNHLDELSIQEIMNFIEELIQKKLIKGVILISHIDQGFKKDNVKEVHLS